MSAPAAADPPVTLAEPLTVAQAKAQVDQLENSAEALDQQALAVKVKLAGGTTALALKQKDVRQQTVTVARIRRQVGQMALAQFQNRSLDTTAKLFLSPDTDGFLNQIATVEKVSDNQNSLLQEFQAEQTHLTDLERAAKVDVSTLQGAAQQMARLRAASAARIERSHAVLARLTAQEQARIKAEELAAEQAAKRAADAAIARAAAAARAQAALARAQSVRPQSVQSQSSQSFGSQGTSSSGQSASRPRDFGSSSTTTIRSTGKGAVALAFAKEQLGKPYVWGATGPNSFDCSGLTSAAWRHAGISIPRVAAAQSTGGGAPVAKADLQAGDLVFFYSPVSHVALYVGNGIVIHAPRPGRTVTYIKMSSMPYAGARRPG